MSTDKCAPPLNPTPTHSMGFWVLYRQVLLMVLEWWFLLLQISLFVQFERIIPALRRAGVALRGILEYANGEAKSRTDCSG